MSPATDFSVALLTHLVARGLRHVVLTPGSRSQALALAAAELDRRGILNLTVRLDERSAAFTALGIARETGLAVAVVTTSGTAVGNLLPAVMEAHHSGVPLIVLSADRPAELRGTGANQTTWQPGIFGAFVRLEVDVNAPSGPADEPVDEVLGLNPDAAGLAAQAMDAALGVAGTDGMPGPVHLNLQFREPLSGDFPEIAVPRLDDPAPSHPSPAHLLEPGPRTVVVAGDGAGADAEEVAHAGGFCKVGFRGAVFGDVFPSCVAKELCGGRGFWVDS